MNKKRDNIKRGRLGWKRHLEKILRLWANKDTLSFTEIHEKFVKLGIVKHKKSTSRILKDMINKGYLEKVNGYYRLKKSPYTFSIADKLEELLQKYGNDRTYEWRVGETLWTLAEGMVIGLPKNVDENPHLKIILEVLLIRLANIFKALKSIALAIGIAEEKGESLNSVTPPEEAVREYLLNIVPHILGERSGIDFDGLPTDDLLEEQVAILSPCNFKQPFSDIFRGVKLSVFFWTQVFEVVPAVCAE